MEMKATEPEEKSTPMEKKATEQEEKSEPSAFSKSLFLSAIGLVGLIAGANISIIFAENTALLLSSQRPAMAELSEEMTREGVSLVEQSVRAAKLDEVSVEISRMAVEKTRYEETLKTQSDSQSKNTTLMAAVC